MTEPVRGIVFFDVDGTLVSTGSSSSHLAARLGHREALDEAERQYADGILTNRQVSEIDELFDARVRRRQDRRDVTADVGGVEPTGDLEDQLAGLLELLVEGLHH